MPCWAVVYLPPYIFMKEQITAVIATALLSNTVITNNNRDSTNINSVGQLVQNTTYDQDDNLTIGTYYQIKTFENSLNVQYATIMGKGYQRLTVNTTENTYKWETDYYFYITYEDGDYPDFTFDNIMLDLRGYLNPNSQISPYYEDYYYYYTFDNNNDLYTFMYEDSYTYNQMQTINNLNIWTQGNNSQIETTGTNATITLPSKYKYVKFKIEWLTDEIYNENDEIITTLIPNLINCLNPVYSTISANYTWTFTKQYEYEVLDIPGLLFQILGMPFAWISTAFNLTIFSGTPYAINISRLIMDIVLGLFLILIVKKMFK